MEENVVMNSEVVENAMESVSQDVATKPGLGSKIIAGALIVTTAYGAYSLGKKAINGIKNFVKKRRMNVKVADVKTSTDDEFPAEPPKTVIDDEEVVD